MKTLCKPSAITLAIITLHLSSFTFRLHASVPLAWDVRPGQPAPVMFDRYHGETLSFSAAFRGFGELPFSPGADVRLWYQTNGMGTAWWSAPATIRSNVLSAVWSPELDPGAERVSLFFGAPSNAYASAVLRLRHSPGFAPASLPLPTPVLDFSAVELRGLAALTNGWSFGDSGGPYLSATGGVVSGTVKVEGKVGTSAVDGHAELGRDGVSIRRAGFPFSSVVKVKWPSAGNGTFARLEDIPAAHDLTDATNYTDAALAEFAATGTVWRSAASAAVEPVSNLVETVRAETALVYRLYSGSNVVVEVTNYNSQVHAPSLRLMQLNESNEYVTVWTETNGLARAIRDATNYADRAIADFAAPRAWSRTTSGLGVEAPANTTWISTPTTVIAGGFEYAKFVDTYGEVWVLSSNGMAAEFNPDTNAYFRITADDGAPVFSVEKTDAQLVGANAAGITVGESTITIPVPVVSSTKPAMYWRPSLSSGDWADESAVNPNYMSVDCTGGPGSWVCTISFDGSRPPMMFFKFNFLQEGAVVIRNNATTDLSSGIYVDGVKFVPSVSGNNLIWTRQ